MRYLVLAAALAGGCGKPAPPTAPPPTLAPAKTPPEVELDPASAAKQHQAAKKSVRP